MSAKGKAATGSSSDRFSTEITERAFGKGKFGGLTGADDFLALAHRDREEHDFAHTGTDTGFVDVEGERRAAVVRHYRSGSITETHLNSDGGMGNHGSYHYSKREDTTYALKKPEKAAGRKVKGTLI